MLKLELELPWPPSVNHYWVQNHRTGKTYVSKEGKAFHEECFPLCRETLAAAHIKDPLACFLAVKITAYPPDNRRRDVDNILKATFDTLVRAGVMEDDRLIRKEAAELMDKADDGKGRLEITITEWRPRVKGMKAATIKASKAIASPKIGKGEQKGNTSQTKKEAALER